MKVPNPLKAVMTRNLLYRLEELKIEQSEVMSEMLGAFIEMPDVCTDGGNDRSFFTFTVEKLKLFAAANEVGGLTIMLPEDY